MKKIITEAELLGESKKSIEEEVAEKIFNLFVNRTDCYAEAYLLPNKKKMAYAKKVGLIDKNLILSHILQERTLGVYQLKGTKLKWGCADFDLNIKEDFENAIKLFLELKNKGFHPFAERSGGGMYKVHIWIFCDCEAKDMFYFLHGFCEKFGIKPHEIFPKQIDASDGYGNLVKLPLAHHLVTDKRSFILDDEFNEIIGLEDIEKKLQYHLDNIDKVPKVIIKEKPIAEFKTEAINANELDKFFNYVLKNELPAGITKENVIIGSREAGINNNILKNLALWLYNKGYTLEQLEKEIKPIYDNKGWSYGDLEGWFKKAVNRDITEISKGELIEWCKNYKKDLIKLIPITTNIKINTLNADLVNKKILLRCQIRGEQTLKAIPKIIIWKCSNCNWEQKIDISSKFSYINSILSKNNFSANCGCDEPDIKFYTKKYMDLSILYTRDLLDNDSTIFERQKYETLKVYLVGKKSPNNKLNNILGKVFVDKKSNDLFIISKEITPIENKIENFKITDELKEFWIKNFHNNDLLYKNINPDIVGEMRDLAKKTVIKILHSPPKMYDINKTKLIRGGINAVFFGDTKNGKSEIALDVSDRGYYNLGEAVVIETSSRTGILYTIDTDKKAVIWGALPLNDLGLVIFDGLQNMPSEELGEFRESIESQKVKVMRSAEGLALARTRILACLNPGRESDKPLNSYLYKCNALQDTFVFKKSPDFTRFDIFIPFSSEDVSSEEIANRKKIERLIPKDDLEKHVYWAWSRKPEQIIYEEEAKDRIKKASIELLENYSTPSLPIVHNGIREVITRISTATACELHSTDQSHELVIVKKEHVEKAIEFYIDVLNSLQIGDYKDDIEGRKNITDTEFGAICTELTESEYKILNEIKIGSKSSSELSSLLNVNTVTINRHYIPLKKHQLIYTKSGSGITLTEKGLKFIKKLQNSDLNNNGGEKT